ncbi:LexA repressor [Candidatus Liberibacter solanacearum]|uniref:transcriptional repressor LexA n=1 Tax=Candidatus Liberibacter solanacearum TaxID=556287 RepID=UPI003871CABA
MLTLKQKELLDFIQEYFDATGLSPSFDEMKKALSIASKSGIYRLVLSLEDRGFIRRIPKRARALKIVKIPDNLKLSERSTQDSGVDGEREKEKFCYSPVPFMGCIAAEVSISSVQNRMRDILVPSTMLREGKHYAFEMEDDSMIGVGILQRDIVVMFSSKFADPGDIVLAFLDDKNATLKRFRQKGDSIALESAHPAYKTRIFRLNSVKIQGKLVGLIRHYYS